MAKSRSKKNVVYQFKAWAEKSPFIAAIALFVATVSAVQCLYSAFDWIRNIILAKH